MKVWICVSVYGRVNGTYLTEVEAVVVCGQHEALDFHCHRICLFFVYVDQNLDCAPSQHASRLRNLQIPLKLW